MKNLCRGNFKFILFIRKSRASYDFGTAPISFRYFYNWTMNFRRDSDIVDSYGPFVAKLGATVVCIKVRHPSFPRFWKNHP